MNKITPGPWKAEYGSYGKQWNVLSGHFVVAEMGRGFVSNQEHGPNSAEADARAIAAVPDMIGALDKIGAALSNWQSILGNRETGALSGLEKCILYNVPELIDAARAALTKAKGE